MPVSGFFKEAPRRVNSGCDEREGDLDARTKADVMAMAPGE
jgi:hypothetical protein